LQQGDYWQIHYQGQTAFIKSMRGLHCLACLLRCPRREFHVSELLVRLLELPAASSAVRAHRRQPGNGNQGIASGLNDGIPVLDAQAKAEYKRRLSELRLELEEAEQFNDPDRATKAHDEMDAIAQHLAAAIGLGGRNRKSSSEAERARWAVTKRIKKAIQKIGDTIPTLGHHLSASVKTGYFCSYKPDPDRPVRWKF
jgi:non-specific serine/threonine protein kinase